MDATERLLKELADGNGGSDYESEIRNIIKRYVEPIGEISHYKPDGLIGKKVGSSTKPKVMLAIKECIVKRNNPRIHHKKRWSIYLKTKGGKEIANGLLV